jgi:amino acid adenylation domain-containing protein
VPLDPEHPAERLGWVLDDARPAALITSRALRERTAGYNGPVLWVDGGAEEGIAPSRTAAAPSAHAAGGASLAYVLYTSGSTGRPKGVCITHAALLNFLHAMQELLHVDARDTLLSVTTFSFDIAGLELWLPLAAGAQVVLADSSTMRDGELLRQAVEHHRPTLLQATPAAWQLLMIAGWEGAAQLKALVGGEALNLDLAQALLRHCREVWNLYGPTETTIWSTACRLRLEDRTASIGRPLANTEAYVLDSRLRPVPLGVAGELYLGGAGLARGYWRRPTETAARFIPHPFAAQPGERLYKTGDQVRRRADGQLEFLGRLDQQIKLRGFRIELAEIESRLREHPAVGEAVVLLRHDKPTPPRLTAYIVPVAGRSASSEELRAHLAKLLPEYMLPAVWVQLDALPISPHGKIDRQALPPPIDESTTTNNDSGPQTQTERELAQLWSETLNMPQVGRRDNFFQLGGHSLIVLKLVARVRERWNVDLPLRRLFHDPTLAGVAACIDELTGSDRTTPHKVIPCADRTGELPLSFGQQRLWFLEQLEPGAAYFHMPLAVRLRGALDRDALAESLRDLILRHEILRTTFPTRDGRPYQSIQTSMPIDVPLIDLTASAPDHRESEMRREAEAEARRPFDLTQGPLIRVRLLRLAAEEHVLLVTLHHIISDGWSLQVLLREAVELYSARLRGKSPELPELPVQYADFAVWQRAAINSEMLATQADYWKRQFENLPLTELPGTRPKVNRQTTHGATYSFVLPAPLVDHLATLSRHHAATLFTTLLSAFAVVMHSYDGREEIAIGTPVAGRDHVEFENLIGLFINLLVIRTQLNGNPSFLELLSRIGHTTQEALVNMDLPFEEVIRAVGAAGTALRAPLFRALFAFQEAVVPALKLDGVEAEVLEVHSGTAMFDFSLFLQRTDTGIAGVIEYDSELFTGSAIRGFASRFRYLLQAVRVQPQGTLSDLRRQMQLTERQAGLAAAASFEVADARKLSKLTRRAKPRGTGAKLP